MEADRVLQEDTGGFEAAIRWDKTHGGTDRFIIRASNIPTPYDVMPQAKKVISKTVAEVDIPGFTLLIQT